MTYRTTEEWLNSLETDESFGDAVWNALVFVDPGPPVAMMLGRITKELKMRYQRDVCENLNR